MTIFKFENLVTGNKRLNSLGDARKLAVLIQTPLYIQEVLLSFGRIKKYEYIKSEDDEKDLTAYYKKKGGIIDWMNSNPVVISSDDEVSGLNLYSSFREDKHSLVIKRNEDLYQFYDEMYKVSERFIDDLIFIPHKFSSRLYCYWLVNGKPDRMELTLPDFHSIFEVNETNNYSYSQIENRILERVSQMFDSVGLSLKYEKNKPNYATSEFIFIENKRL